MTTYDGHLGTWQQQPGSGSASEQIDLGMFQWFTHLQHNRFNKIRQLQNNIPEAILFKIYFVQYRYDEKKNGSIEKVIQICMIKLLHLKQNRTLNKKMIAVTMPEDDTQC